MAVPCPVCGFDARPAKPGDAAVALRSYPRRYRAVLVRPEEDEADDAVRRAGSSGWSALGHVRYAARAIRAAREALQAALVHGEPAVTLPAVDPASPEPAAGGIDAALADLETATEEAAAAIGQAHGKEWSRRATTGDGTVTAEEIAALAAHLGVHHLRATEAVLREVIGHP